MQCPIRQRIRDLIPHIYSITRMPFHWQRLANDGQLYALLLISAWLFGSQLRSGLENEYSAFLLKLIKMSFGSVALICKWCTHKNKNNTRTYTILDRLEEPQTKSIRTGGKRELAENQWKKQLQKKKTSFTTFIRGYKCTRIENRQSILHWRSIHNIHAIN